MLESQRWLGAALVVVEFFLQQSEQPGRIQLCHGEFWWNIQAFVHLYDGTRVKAYLDGQEVLNKLRDGLDTQVEFPKFGYFDRKILDDRQYFVGLLMISASRYRIDPT